MSLLLSHNNHFKYGFGSEYSEDINAGDFKFEFGVPSRWPNSPLEEAARAAQLIYDSASGPVRVCFSGGVDSECVMRSLIRAKVPFVPTIVELTEDLNQHDTKWAHEFCKTHSLKPEVLKLDLFDVYQNQFDKFFNKYQFVYPEFAFHAAFMEQLDGTLILSGTIPQTLFTTDLNEYVFTIPPYPFYFFNEFFKINNRPGVGHFYFYTPELYESFKILPLNLNRYQLQREIDGLPIYQFKVGLYRQGGFDVQAKPSKYNGLEHFKKVWQDRYGKRWYQQFQEKILEVRPEFIQFIGA